jgi:hypothetical protein
MLSFCTLGYRNRSGKKLGQLLLPPSLFSELVQIQA